ncbi:MAG: hypothetical protein BGO09_06705 [Bacteroidetes bacterium 47-18]|nr:MAG: hypothetical protein BGO09_06705 [Bacteroidetes bacterium 47-18]
MNYHREFEIGWFGLALGVHHFQYEIDKEKLKRLEYPEIQGFQDFKFNIHLKFDKKSSFFLLKFEIDGTAKTVCDRCGDDLDLEIWDEFDLVIKLTSEAQESTEDDDEGDVVFIPRSETVIDISEWIYEFIQLSIPIQLKHPDDEEGHPTCNPESLKMLKQFSKKENEHPEEGTAGDEPPAQNPKDIWKDLDKFKF